MTVITLRNLGATDSQIRRIFLFEGRMISAAGAVIGIALGLLLCWLQQTYGLVQLGDQAGNFVVNAYPISVHPEDYHHYLPHSYPRRLAFCVVSCTLYES